MINNQSVETVLHFAPMYVGPDYSQPCRPEQANAAAAGTSVASRRSDLPKSAKLHHLRLRRSGNHLRDLVPAYVNNPR
jgi:hypothetical protein